MGCFSVRAEQENGERRSTLPAYRFLSLAAYTRLPSLPPYPFTHSLDATQRPAHMSHTPVAHITLAPPAPYTPTRSHYTDATLRRHHR